VTKRPTRRAFGCSAVALAATLCLWGAPAASAQSDSSPPQSSVRGENFSAKPAPALFQSDCTGSGCHKGPQGLAKNHSQSGLAGFLREHYTNSRESAAALSNYLVRLPAGPAPPEPRAARTSPRGAPSPGGATDGPSWFGPDPAPGPNEARTPRQQQQPQQPGTRPPARAAARSGDDAAPAATPAAAEPAKPQPTPRAQRGRQQPTAAAAAAPPAPEAAPPPPPPAPPPPQFDIFD
jgi:hypothetical protein